MYDDSREALKNNVADIVRAAFILISIGGAGSTNASDHHPTAATSGMAQLEA